MATNWGLSGKCRLKRQHLLKILDERAGTPSAANALIKALRQVFKFAVEYGYHNENPAIDISYLKSKNPEGIHPWSRDEIEQFKETHPIGSTARLAMGLLFYTCQRRSDIVKLGRQNIIDGHLEFTQVKGRNKNPIRLSFPILKELQQLIDALPVDNLTFLLTSFNKPFTTNGFGNKFRKWCNEAGLPQCSAHGLRKSAAIRMAESGLNLHEIMAQGGWTTLKEVQRYTKGVHQRTLADSGAEKLEKAWGKDKN